MLTIDITEIADIVAQPPPADPVHRQRRALLTGTTIASRLSLVVLGWLVLTGQPSVLPVTLLGGAMVAGYLGATALSPRLVQRLLPGLASRPALGADHLTVGLELGSALLLAVAAWAYPSAWGLGIVGVVLAAVRAVSDQRLNLANPAPVNDYLRRTPPRHALARTGAVVAGLALGAVTVWLGQVGLIWLLAVIFLANAVVALGHFTVAGATSLDAAAPGLGSQGAAANEPGDFDDDFEGDFEDDAGDDLGDDVGDDIEDEFADESAFALGSGNRALLRHRPYQVLAWVLAATALLGTVASLAGVVVWARFVATSTVDLSLFGGAFIIGAVGGALVFTAFCVRADRALLVALGYLLGGGAVAIAGRMATSQLLVVVAALIAGLAFASVTAVAGLRLTSELPAAQSAWLWRLNTFATWIGVAAGCVAAGLLVQFADLTVALGLVATCFVAAALVAAFAGPAWASLQPIVHQPLRVLRRLPKLPARLTVTLVYTDGEWIVEVRRGRELLGSRHAVTPADALAMLSQLDQPSINARVERAVEADRGEATRQVDRMRRELAELEAKLSSLAEMNPPGA